MTRPNWNKRICTLAAIVLGNMLAWLLVAMTLLMFGTDHIWSRLRALAMLLVFCLIALLTIYQRKPQTA